MLTFLLTFLLISKTCLSDWRCVLLFILPVLGHHSEWPVFHFKKLKSSINILLIYFWYSTSACKFLCASIYDTGCRGSAINSRSGKWQKNGYVPLYIILEHFPHVYSSENTCIRISCLYMSFVFLQFCKKAWKSRVPGPQISIRQRKITQGLFYKLSPFWNLCFP